MPRNGANRYPQQENFATIRRTSPNRHHVAVTPANVWHVRVINLLAQGPQLYERVDQQQRALHQEVADGAAPALILVEMQSVYTAGRRTGPWDIVDENIRVVDVDRGGRITWHGPGQIVAYPIVRLRQPIDVVKYVRVLEQAVMDTCAHYAIGTQRVQGRSGVWMADPPRKICAVGVRVAQGATLHGIALNVANSLEPYRHIVPCGISDAAVTTMAEEVGITDLPGVAEKLTANLTTALTPIIHPAAVTAPTGCDPMGAGTATVSPVE